MALRSGEPLGLYDLASDPGERDDRQRAEGQRLAELLELLARWRGAVAGGAEQPPSRGWADEDDEVRRRLRDLGYGE